MRGARSFVLGHTKLCPVPGLEEVRLHLASEILPLWRAVGEATGDDDPPLPYWGFAWVGGLAIGRHLRERPELVAGLRVLDLASGSGMCAIRAALAGSAEVTAVDIDPFAEAAIKANARANGVRITVVGRDLLDEPPPEVDVILAGDCWYEAGLAGRVLPWLRAARARNMDVIIGDAGRRYLPLDALTEVGAYDVHTTTELEDLALKRGRVFVLRDP